jgi:dipeptidyl aminopeptidase/acylaminoacyl peptidase
LAGAVIAALATSVHGQAPSGTANFTIFVGARPVGSEQVQLQRTDQGWTISSSGRVGAPVDLILRQLEARYDSEWRPLGLRVDTTVRGRSLTIRSTVDGTTVTSETTPLGAAPVEQKGTIDALGIFVVNPVVAPFEAVAARLKTAPSGTTLSLYRPGQGSSSATVGESSVERIKTLRRMVTARRTHLSVESPGAAPLSIEVWSDEEGRLLRVRLPFEDLDALREDIASVSSRRVSVSRPNDEDVRIPANGFSLAGTVSKPLETSGPLPAIILVAGSAPVDREEITSGVPVFGQLATALADAGFVVLRYDKRGTGQSGGRPESAALRDYSEDLRAAVKMMADRKDVDRKRLALLGYAEGGWISMMAAGDKRVSAIALVGSIGVTGAELNMYQVVHSVERSGRPDAEKQQVIELQKKIQEAVLTGKGWDAINISSVVRRQADTPYFQSFLAFDPAKALKDVSQPVLIVHGELDTEVPASNADQLEAAAKARKRTVPTDVVKIPKLNHLLVPATSGETDEYDSLSQAEVSPEVVSTVASWLRKVLSPRP